MGRVHRDAAGEAWARDVRACREIIARHSKSFSFALSFLPHRIGDDVAVVYAYYRTVDDIVDEAPRHVDPDTIRAQLADWDEWLREGPRHDDSSAIRRLLPSVIHRCGLSVQDLRTVLSGQRADVEYRRVATMQELEEYAFAVAGSVGHVMAGVLGAPSEGREPASSLGIAMQLTNVCRDVAEDLDRGRIYLPLDICDEVGCHDRVLEGRIATPEVRAAVRIVAARARELYAEGAGGLVLLPDHARFPIDVAAHAYEGILDRLAARDHDVFSGRVSLGPVDRWRMAARLAVGRLHVSGRGTRPVRDRRWAQGASAELPAQENGACRQLSGVSTLAGRRAAAHSVQNPK